LIGLPDFFESRRVILLRHPPSAASNVDDSVEVNRKHTTPYGKDRQSDPYNRNLRLLERASSQYHSL
jgi:hypothetical protein